MRVRTGMLTAVSVAGVLAMGAQALAETRGYAVTWFQPAMYTGDDDCPDGLNKSPDFAAIFKAEGKTAEQIKDLIDHPNSKEFGLAVINRGPHGENVCADPASVPDPQLKTGKGKIAWGFNLDGKTDDGGAPAPNTCAHAKYVSPDGTPGIDNQMYRALSCMVALRGKRGHDGFVMSYIMERMRAEGLRTYLVEIKGIDDPRNNKDVEVGIYLGSDPLVLDAKGEVRRDTTQRISKDPRWHNVVHGTMKDGVITTDVFNLNLLGDPIWVPEFHFKQAKMQLTLQDDGTIKGTVGGYQDLMAMYYNTSKSGILFETTNAATCPGVYYALKKMADGAPDPKTGECTQISTAFTIEALPAFVIHQPGDTSGKTAQNGSAGHQE
ncbi:MAG TPA: hypothetical protein VL899_11035 [Alphaproteobacteria bacterium]|nr:hypothetical protein [Alphaproteobacteria bacterium]